LTKSIQKRSQNGKYLFQRSQANKHFYDLITKKTPRNVDHMLCAKSGKGKDKTTDPNTFDGNYFQEKFR